MATAKEIESSLIAKYKGIRILQCNVVGDCVLIDAASLPTKKLNIAKFILNRNKDVHSVHFIGGWDISIFTRDTIARAI